MKQEVKSHKILKIGQQLHESNQFDKISIHHLFLRAWHTASTTIKTLKYSGLTFSIYFSTYIFLQKY